EAKEFPIHLDISLARHIFHPARRNPTPWADDIPVKIDGIFDFAHCSLPTNEGYVTSYIRNSLPPKRTTPLCLLPRLGSVNHLPAPSQASSLIMSYQPPSRRRLRFLPNALASACRFFRASTLYPPP